jgi:Zn finger protein HypA/HybF involved in hydrogenase expression
MSEGAGSERYGFCPSCGAEAATGGSFCGECGLSLVKTPAGGTVRPLTESVDPVLDDPSPIPSPYGYCPSCRSRFENVLPGAECTKCGTTVVPTESSPYGYCPSCGSKFENVPTGAECTKCGTKVIPVASAYGYCPSCGSKFENVPFGAECTTCGTKVIATEAAPSGHVKEHPSPTDNEGSQQGHRRRLGFGILIAIVVVAAGGAGIVIANHHSTAPQASFGPPCSQNPACSGSSAASPQNAAPTSSQMSAAYQSGYRWGQLVSNPNGQLQPPSEFTVESSCKGHDSQNLQLETQYFNGCMAGAGY